MEALSEDMNYFYRNMRVKSPEWSKGGIHITKLRIVSATSGKYDGICE